MSSPRLRLTVITPFGVMGGAENWLLQLLDATDRLDVDAILLKDGPLRGELEQRGLAVTMRSTGRAPAEILATSAWLVPQLRRRDPEVVLANGVKAAATAIPACRLTGVPVVWAKHDHAFDARLARPLARLADRLVAAVEELAEPTGRPDAVIVPPPRPDQPPADRGEARRFWLSRGVTLDGGPNLVMATRLVPYKGVDDAIAALALEPAGGWRLFVIGDEDPSAPGEAERLRRVAVSLGVAGRVHFLDRVEGVSQWLAAFDALAVLTKVDELGFGREGFGTSAFEAMLAGVPVVGVEGGAVVRRLAGRAGVAVPPGDPQAVARALGKLGRERDRREAGRAARELVADHPNAQACADRLVGVLAEAAARPGAGLDSGPPVSVVVTVLNEGRGVDRLLTALVPQLAPPDELLLVDGGSSDDTAARVQRWADRDPRVRLLEAPGTNIPRGRNAGVAAATHDHIACTDAGCAPRPGWLQALRTAFMENPSPDLVAGVYRVSEHGPFQAAMAASGYADPGEVRRAGPLVRAYGRLLGRTFDPTMPATRSIAFTKETWEAVGGFPAHLDTAEDPAFGRAVAATGRRCVLQADAEVVWEQRSSIASTAKMYYRYGVGGGLSGDRKIIGRDLVRLAAYTAGPLLWWRGGRSARMAVAAGAGWYLSLPLWRTRRRKRPLVVAALIPVALTVKDVSKSVGCLMGLARRRHTYSEGAVRSPSGDGWAP